MEKNNNNTFGGEFIDSTQELRKHRTFYNKFLRSLNESGDVIAQEFDWLLFTTNYYGTEEDGRAFREKIHVETAYYNLSKALQEFAETYIKENDIKLHGKTPTYRFLEVVVPNLRDKNRNSATGVDEYNQAIYTVLKKMEWSDKPLTFLNSGMDFEKYVETLTLGYLVNTYPANVSLKELFLIDKMMSRLFLFHTKRKYQSPFVGTILNNFYRRADIENFVVFLTKYMAAPIFQNDDILERIARYERTIKTDDGMEIKLSALNTPQPQFFNNVSYYLSENAGHFYKDIVFKWVGVLFNCEHVVLTLNEDMDEHQDGVRVKLYPEDSRGVCELREQNQFNITQNSKMHFFGIDMQRSKEFEKNKKMGSSSDYLDEYFATRKKS